MIFEVIFKFYVFEFKVKKKFLLIHKNRYEKRTLLKKLYWVKHSLPSTRVFRSGTTCVVYKTFFDSLLIARSVFLRKLSIKKVPSNGISFFMDWGHYIAVFGQA